MTQAVAALFGKTAPQQDYIVLAGQTSPGLAVVTGAGAPRNWEERKGWGLSGATIVYTGAGLAQFDVQISLGFSSDDWAAWDDFAKLLEKAPTGKRPKALDIEHPLINMRPINIKSVVVTDVSQFEQDDYGIFTCSISFKEFKAPLPALAKPDQSIAAVNPTKPTAQDETEKQIQEAMAELAVVKAS